MVEGEGCPPPASGDADDGRTGRDGCPAGEPRRGPADSAAPERTREEESPPPPDGSPDGSPDGVPSLLGLLGRLLEGHAPDEIALLLREELEGREFKAYADGWRDAALHFTPLLEEARAARTRPLRLVDRTRGRGSVIPFPRDRHLPYAADPDPATEHPDTAPERPAPGHGHTQDHGHRHGHEAAGDGAATEEPAPQAAVEPPPTGAAAPSYAPATPAASATPETPAVPDTPGHADPAGPDPAGPDPAASPASPPAGSEGAPSPAPRHAFVPKSRSSKVPTIPRIAAPRRPRRGQPGAGGRTRQPSVPEDEGA
ncbi:hypothetical protein [Streptomyces fradiae]|uniref:hypothetical protein n=1 Tax=Streptomyces fradiae TaxID=1906 RepID=UPI003665B0A1